MSGKKALEDLIVNLPDNPEVPDKDWDTCVHCSPDRILDIAAYVATLEARATAAEERVKRLEDVLKPFAKLAGLYDPVEDDDGDKCWCVEASPTLGNLRAARAALTGDKP